MPDQTKHAIGSLLRPHENWPDIRERIDLPLQEQLANAGFDAGMPVHIRIFKEDRQLEVWLKPDDTFKLFKSYEICNFSGDLGPKLKEGDRQSPEGFYRVDRSALNPNSRYHLSFNLGFPNRFDQSLGRTGSYLMVHGSCVSIGCYAMTDAGIEEIYFLVESALKNGQHFVSVNAYPFRMTPERLEQESTHQWYAFWQNLKSGYDIFEATRNPAAVTTLAGEYHFTSAD
ncbi:murein L,D-transpeptidase [Halocynthiibacter sp. C4]|uniref:L,D-transpeptidase family protein n=1 Tax=Halocynthiibacter sp. C4 TaxID=2992758 RepID=UPI00237C1F5D|nr:murein L,D-transpeptidase family protein [Halocynthiibacter sp. C4]MDE0588454.1 murein L,D-transpeptidase [Halocynthiibacter sp. C4]